MSNAELAEVLRLVLGALGVVLTIDCIPGTISEYLTIRRHYPEDRERHIVAISWIRAAVFRMLTAVLLAVSGLLLMMIPDGPSSQTPERLIISWGWVLCAAYVDVQAIWARWDRHRIRKLRP